MKATFRRSKFWYAAAVVLFGLGFLAPVALARMGTAWQSDEAVRAENAASVLGEIMEAPDRGIPDGLLNRASARAVIPHVVKGAFGFGGRYRKGSVAQRTAHGGWGTPLFVEIGGGSLGLQIGVEATDVVVVFTNDEGLTSLLASGLMIGADASATAGPVGRRSAPTSC